MTILGDLLTDARSGFACGQEDPAGVFQFRMNNVTMDGRLDLSARRRVPSNAHKSIERFALVAGDVLFNATNSPDNVGKSVLVPELDEAAVFSNHFLRLRTHPARLDPGYLARWLQWNFSNGLFRSMCKQWVNQATVGRDRLLAVPIEPPRLEEQRRIAAILDQAVALRAKRRQALGYLGDLPQSVFFDMFGDNAPAPSRRLGELAHMTSGLTKGRKLNGQATQLVPYLAVANVQLGRLDLKVVKQIEATAAEVDRLALRRGDLLLTEGGDPDKLGRGTLWKGELPLALHQNHIFRVRLRHDSWVLPEYLSAFVASREARSYFLRSAKQTTGIASINMTQLKGLGVPVPSMSSQQRFVEALRACEVLTKGVAAQERADSELLQSLQHRAFVGGL